KSRVARQLVENALGKARKLPVSYHEERQGNVVGELFDFWNPSPLGFDCPAKALIDRHRRRIDLALERDAECQRTLRGKTPCKKIVKGIELRIFDDDFAGK